MAKPYNLYQPGEIVALTHYSTLEGSTVVQLTKTPVEDKGAWVVQGRKVVNGKVLVGRLSERRWVALTITPRPFAA